MSLLWPRRPLWSMQRTKPVHSGAWVSTECPLGAPLPLRPGRPMLARRTAPHRAVPRRAASHLGAQHRTAAQPPRTAAHGAASQRSSAASASACAALGGVAGGRRSELGGETHGAQANMRRGNLQRAEKAQHAAQVGCHSHRRRGQASTRAHFRAATLNRATENLLFFDLRC